MNRLIAAAVVTASLIVSTGVYAGSIKKTNVSTDANVPTGSDVPGCTNYRTYPGGRTEQVCDPNSVKDLLKDLQSNTVGAYTSAFGSPGSGTGAAAE